jgi:hypothetical protein
LAVVFLSGGLAATTIAHPSPFNGLIERITIGGFLQWLFVISYKVYAPGINQETSIHLQQAESK